MRVGLDRGDVSLLTSATAVRSSLQDRGVSGTAMLDLARDHLSIFFYGTSCPDECPQHILCCRSFVACCENVPVSCSSCSFILCTDMTLFNAIQKQARTLALDI